MPSYNNLESKLEACFVALLQAALPTQASHFPGFTGALNALPKTWSYAHTAEPLIENSDTGIHNVPFEIGIESAGLTDPNDASPEIAHNNLVALVRDAILTSDLAARLNAAAAAMTPPLDLTVIDVNNPAFTEDIETLNFRNLLRLSVTAANATI